MAYISRSMMVGHDTDLGTRLSVSAEVSSLVKREAILDEDIHHAPTRVIALENTLGGTILPLQEVARIRQFATANGLKMHLVSA